MDEFKREFFKNGRVIRGTWQNKANHKIFADCLGFITVEFKFIKI